MERVALLVVVAQIAQQGETPILLAAPRLWVVGVPVGALHSVLLAAHSLALAVATEELDSGAQIVLGKTVVAAVAVLGVTLAQVVMLGLRHPMVFLEVAAVAAVVPAYSAHYPAAAAVWEFMVRGLTVRGVYPVLLVLLVAEVAHQAAMAAAEDHQVAILADFMAAEAEGAEAQLDVAHLSALVDLEAPEWSELSVPAVHGSSRLLVWHIHRPQALFFLAHPVLILGLPLRG